MSQKNVAIVRRGFEHFMAAGEFLAENTPRLRLGHVGIPRLARWL